MIGGKKLRVDAQALKWYELSRTQQQAVSRLLEMLDDATRHASDDVDFQRSRSLSISGARGTGKTTAVLTARNYCDGTFSREDPGTSASGPEARRQGWQEVQRLVKDVGDHLVWLSPLQMDPLPHDTNLVGAVLARIRRAVEVALRRNTGRTQPRGTHLDARNEIEDALHRLYTLETEGITAFDGNLGKRAPYLDAEVFAVAATGNEDVKLQYREDLNRVLGELAVLIPNGGRNKVFVLPVDDFDTSPARAVELMKLLYSLSVPRLFVIYLGAIDIADKMLYFEIQKQFRDLMGGLETADGTAKADIAAAANEIASTSLRKMLPPSQRVVLTPLRLEEALEYRPPGAGGDERSNGRSSPEGEDDEQVMRELLRRIEIRTSGLPEGVFASAGEEGAAHGKTSLLHLLETKLPGSNPPVYIYQAADLLRAPARQVADFWLSLPRRTTRDGALDEDTVAAELIDRVVGTVNNLVDEDARLNVAAQRAIKQSILTAGLDDAEHGATEWELHPSELRVRPQFGDELRVEIAPQMASGTPAVWQAFRRRFQARRVRKLDLRVNDQTRQRVTLSDRTRAAMVLLHDLLLMTEQGVVAGELKEELQKERAFCEWSDGLSDGFKVPWNTRSWATFWHADMATAVWNQGERLARRILREQALMDSNDIVLLLAYAWMAGGAAALLPHRDVKSALQPLFPPPSKRERAAEKAWSWDSLQLETWNNLGAVISRIAKKANERRSRHLDDRYADELDEWLVGLACLWMPESGIPWDHRLRVRSTEDGEGRKPIYDDKPGPWAATISEALNASSQTWDRLAPKVRDERLRRLGHFAATPLGVILLNPAQAAQWIRQVQKADPDAAVFKAKRREYLGNLATLLSDENASEGVHYAKFSPDGHALAAMIERTLGRPTRDIHPADLEEVKLWLSTPPPKNSSTSPQKSS